jgi:hypothetical protein
LRILRADGTPIVADQPGQDVGAARAVVARLEHIARWEQLRALGGHPSRLRDAVRLAVYPASTGEVRRPEGRRALAAGSDYRLDYSLVDGHWRAPAMFLELANTSDRDLFVGVLDLTDRFRVHASLFPTGRIAAGHTVVVWQGRAIPVAFPPGRSVTPGAVAHDWMKVIVSETDFDATAFELPPIDEPFEVRRSAPTGSTLERLAHRVLTRGAPDAAASGSNPDWCAETYAVTIGVS